ncbi:hypothetical protein F5Y02DRAFT_375252 [Annulohypoxylon stygium]|nr:hypothetical protein F5Y02DRAFT_375252 [Annulohypoxylon stygium]
MPSTYSVSSEITTSIMSTVYSTNIVTITSCAASVTNCPVGKVTTETKSLYTTICPVTHTVLDGTTYGGTEAVQETSITGGFTYSMSSFHPTETESSASPSSSILSHSSGLVNSASASASSSVLSSSSVKPVASSESSIRISSSASESSSGYVMSSPSKSAGASSSILSSSAVVQNATASISRGIPVASSLSYSESGPASSSATQMTTSTVYSTNVYTITSCAPDVTNCPARLGQVTTDLVSLYTTICPVTATETKTRGSSSALPVATETSASSQQISSYATERSISPSSQSVSASVSASLSKSSTTEVVSSHGASSVATYPAESSHSQAASSHATPAQSSVTSAPSYSASAPSYTTSTVYSTNVYTVTSCAPGVTNCPAKGSVTTETVAVSTTVCPVEESSKGIAGSSVPVAGVSQYTTAAITISNTLSGSVIVVTSTISFVDTPRPTSVYPTEGAGTTTSAGTAAVGSSGHVTKPGTTISLGTYFTSFIGYDTITQHPPASVSTGAVPTSYYTGSSATVDVPSYHMSQESSTVVAGPSSVPVAASGASSYPAAPPSPAIPKEAPGVSTYPLSPDSDDTTTLTSSLTNTHTVTQSGTGKHLSTCACDQPTVYVTVTETAAKVTVTSTVQPPFPSSYPTGTAPASQASEGAEGTDAYPTSKPAGIRRWLRRGHANGGHGH